VGRAGAVDAGKLVTKIRRGCVARIPSYLHSLRIN
jgi:hypothetical protein